MEVYRAGRVALANAPGTGVADDKAVYAYVPQIIQLLPGRGHHPAQRADVSLLASRQAVLARAGQSRQAGGQADQRVGRLRHVHRPARDAEQERDDCRGAIEANPRNYIAQPTLALSRVPTIVGEQLEGRHVDLRPYILYGKDIYVLPGGLTRVALQERLAGGQLLAGRRQQGHLGACRAWPTGRASDARRQCRRESVSGRRGADAMLSRVADSVYWMSRYLERAENVARFIDVNLNLMLDMRDEAGEQWLPLSTPPATTSPFSTSTGGPRGRTLFSS